MSNAMVPLAVASTVLNYQASQAQGQAAQQIGQRRQQAANFQASQLDVNAGQAQAEGQVAAINQDRNTSLTLSRARAVAAASGGGASDPTVINLMAQIAGEGEYRANVARYQGDTQARSMREQASALRYGGDMAVADAQTANQGAQLKGVTSLISGAANVYDMGKKYGWGAST